MAGSAIVAGEVKAGLVERSSVSPVSLLAFSVQVRLIWEVEMALALRLVGAATVAGGALWVVAEAALDQPEDAEAFWALSR